MESQGLSTSLKTPPTVPMLSQKDAVHTLPSHLRNMLILPSHLCIVLPSGLFPSAFPIKPLFALLFTPIHATCPAHQIFINLITQIIFGNKYKSLSSSLCSFLQSPVTSSLLGPNTCYSTLFSNTHALP